MRRVTSRTARHVALPTRRGLSATAAALITIVLTVAGLSLATGSATARTRIVLTPGDHGPRVVKVQKFLKVRPASGTFGPKTKRAVKRWQRAHGRHATGKVGIVLWRVVKGGRAPAASRSDDRVEGLNWAALARCESGGNPRAVNPAGYYGLYQFSPSTWRSVGGSGLPSRASRAEQTNRAQTLFRRSGSSPWPNCGRHLFD